MDRGRWQEIEEAFHRAVELPEDERRRFLDELKAGDRDLHAEVESLLSRDAAEDEPVFDAVEEAIQHVAFEGTEQRTFGPYKAGRWLGGGSQSDVYLAERTDGEYRSKVAIKVAKRGFPTEDLRRRFRQERQILANLRHTNIARVLDGGTTEEGLPFFVMEYVDGEPIDDYCDRRRLSIAERLRLFLSVCSAVEHAHRNLIIHRDLKPGNILVAEDGRPILLDFGIAKLLEEPAHVDAAVRTVEGLRFLTPAYASPEQVLGEPLTTSADVYSLGIVLYGLLCGRPPYELDGLEPKALYETICETRPSAPSRSLRRSESVERDRALARARDETAGGLRHRLQGDLDTIVLMALRKEPERRYASVATLAEDVEHFLRHRPIRARKEAVGYRLSKLVRRHPYGVAATVALLLTVVVGVASTMRATWVAQAQRDQARISQAEAERVTEFMVGLFEVSSPEVSLGEKVSAVEVLDRGAELIEGELSEQPLSRARLLNAMGRAYHGLGLYPKAEELLREVIVDREKVLGPTHQEVAEGLLDLARSELVSGDYSRAEEGVRRSLEIYAEIGSSVAEGKAAALNLLAEIRLRQGELEPAEELYRQALELRSSLLGAQHLDSLESLNDLAETLVAGRRLDEAREFFDQVLKGRRRLLSDAHPEVVKVLNNIAVVQQQSGDLEGAEATMREVVEARRRLYGESHPHVALAYNNLGQVLSFQGKHEEALIWAQQALDLSVDLYQAGHPGIANLSHSLGRVLEQLERLEEAEGKYLDSLAIRREAHGEGHPSVAQSLVALAALHHRQGRMDRALEEARESFRILDAALPPEDYRRSSPQLQIGLLLADTGRCDEALPFIEQVLALRRKYLPEGHPALSSAVAAQDRCG
ncbi:MAG: serine/threonine protein kinase [bacterium]|nr:serine/threonine protein kinase [bacterium]